MKATLEFSDEEQEELQDALNASTYKFIISDVLKLLRDKVKYENAHEEVSILREQIIQIVNDSLSNSITN